MSIYTAQKSGLTNDQILNLAPSIGATAPKNDVSDLYNFIPTIQVVDVMRDHGWMPYQVSEVKSRKEKNKGYQKHLIRFQHPDLMLGDEMIDAVMVNSHDRTACYQFFTGVFRFLCSNGMIVGDTFEKIKVRHIGGNTDDIIDASFQVLETAPVIATSMNEMKKIELTDPEKKAFAAATMDLLYEDPEEAPFPADRLIMPRRWDEQKTDLWTTFNTVQENVMRGGIRGLKRVNGRVKRSTTREIKSIDKNIKLNKALWTLAEKMKDLKQAA